MEISFEVIITENVPNLGKKTDIQILEAQRIPIGSNKSKPTARLTVIKFAKYSDKKI